MNQIKKRTRFNFIDAVILLIVLVIIGAATYLVVSDLRSQQNSRQIGNMDFTVRISDVKEEALSLFTNGTTVKDSVSGAVLGEITAVNMKKTKYFGTVAIPYSEDEYTLPISEYSDKYDVYVTIKTTAARDANGIHYAGENTKILVGSTVYFKIPSFTSISYITEFNPMEN